jgi:hypothetical protein
MLPRKVFAVQEACCPYLFLVDGLHSGLFLFLSLSRNMEVSSKLSLISSLWSMIPFCVSLHQVTYK